MSAQLMLTGAASACSFTNESSHTDEDRLGDTDMTAANFAASSKKRMLERYVSPFRVFGLFAGLVYAIDRALARLSPAFRLHFYDLMVQPIPERTLPGSHPSRTLEIREIERGDPAVALMPARPEINEARFAQNAICLGAYRHGELIGYIWFCFRAYEEDEVRCTYALSPESEAVFDFDLYIYPEHRMGRAFVQIWDESGKFLRSRGIRYTYSRITRFNVESRSAHRHLGSTRVARMMVLRAGSMELLAATVFPYLHLSMRKSARARLTLRPDALLRSGHRTNTSCAASDRRPPQEPPARM
jgi:hypothetical protein